MANEPSADVMSLEELGERIQRRRRDLGLTQAQLADRARISKETIGRLEQGVGSPTLDTVFKLARALGTTGSAMLATCVADELLALVGSLPQREQEIACVMLRALSTHANTCATPS